MLKFVAFLILSLVPILAQAQTFEKTVSIPAPKEGASRYFYLSFEVPAKTKSLTLSYPYDRKKGANVLDLGVFDSRFDSAETNVKEVRDSSGKMLALTNPIFVRKNS